MASGADVRAVVAGREVFFKSRQANLTLSAEALGTAFLLPAAFAGRRLVGGEVDPVWLQGATSAWSLVGHWWNWKAKAPDFKTAVPRQAAPGVGLAFSLGIDSFYSLFFSDRRPTHLLLAGGFDVPIANREVLEAMSNSVSDVSKTLGIDWVLIETNLRQHRLFKRLNWEFSHGGAVATLGHLMRETCGRLLVSSSFHQSESGPWGSHADLDPLWSSSSVEIEHFGDDVSRREKLRRLIQHPVAGKLLQKHLRVCWVAPNKNGNCGRCRKCLLLRASLELLDPGFRLDTMPDSVELAPAIKALAPAPDRLVLNFWRELQGGNNLELDLAVRDLVRRSELSLGS